MTPVWLEQGAKDAAAENRSCRSAFHHEIAETPMNRFAKNDIVTLVGEAPRYDLAESLGPDIRLAEVLDVSGRSSMGEMRLAYGTPAGDPRLRRAIADLHDVHPDDVVVTVGGMHALFLLAFILCGRGGEAVTTAPLFPPARNALQAVGANVRTLTLSFDRGYQPDAAEFRRHL